MNRAGYNTIIRGESDQEWEYVETAFLVWIVEDLLGKDQQIDIVKMDCEGAENEILLASRLRSLQRVKEIRFEYHRGRVGDLVAHLEGCGYTVRLLAEESVQSGRLWPARTL